MRSLWPLAAWEIHTCTPRKSSSLLINGLRKAASEYGFKMVFWTPAMPFMSFSRRDQFFKLQRFCALAANEVSFSTPPQLVSSAAHDEFAITQAIEAEKSAFAKLSEEL